MDKSQPKILVLDMFPYPSRGRTAFVIRWVSSHGAPSSARVKRLKVSMCCIRWVTMRSGCRPSSMRVIQTGQHPAATTEKNINRYANSSIKIGFGFDWDREVRTCYPEYYKWTQWAFLSKCSIVTIATTNSRRAHELVAAFEQGGTDGLNVACTKELAFTAAEWNAMGEAEKENVLQNYRLAFRADTLSTGVRGSEPHWPMTR